MNLATRLGIWIGFFAVAFRHDMTGEQALMLLACLVALTLGWLQMDEDKKP